MLWYGQFLFYGTAHVKMGAFKFVSWALHMIMLILISSLLGIVLKDWKACRPRTKWSVAAAIVLLIVSVLAISNGSHIGSAAG
jgi:L-rhamnose-H+ transport protein